MKIETGLLAEAGVLQDTVVALRRRLHRHPELGLELPKTQAAVVDALADVPGLAISTGSSLSSVIGVLDGDLPGPTLLLRADMDALPLQEETAVEFASTVPGAMHACGHDAHTAMLVGGAHLLSAHRSTLAGRVIFMFQPGEEGFDGARRMLDEGLLDSNGPVDRACAVHVDPLAPAGTVATRGGTIQASGDQFGVTVRGRGGHAARPHDAIDPIPVACEIVLALQSMLTRRVSVFDPVVLTIGRVTAGASFGIIPAEAVLEGTIRAMSEESRQVAVAGLRRVAEGVAAAHLCTAEVTELTTPFPVSVNDVDVSEQALAVAVALLGSDHVMRLPNPIMPADDWGHVLHRVPGVKVLLGVRPPELARPEPNHSSRMVIDESALTVGTAFNAAMALDGTSAHREPIGRVR
ncbi:MAG TPA: M20 family metallopeptidase [Mycobacteriales bacterium]